MTFIITGTPVPVKIIKFCSISRINAVIVFKD